MELRWREQALQFLGPLTLGITIGERALATHQVDLNDKRKGDLDPIQAEIPISMQPPGTNTAGGDQ